MKKLYRIEQAQSAPGVPHATQWKIKGPNGLVLPEWMFTEEQAVAIAAALNEAATHDALTSYEVDMASRDTRFVLYSLRGLAALFLIELAIELFVWGFP